MLTDKQPDSKNEVPLKYTINEEAKYQVYYSLDNFSNGYPLLSNTTLTGLSEGQHRIRIRAINWNGNSIYSEQPTYFTIDTSKANQQIVYDNLITYLGSILGIIVVIIVLVVIINERRKLSGKQSFL